LVAGPHLKKAKYWGHVSNMPNVRTKIRVVEVIAPDGQKSFWVAAVPEAKAVEAKTGNSTEL
jgi:hypothetical protein